MHFLRSVLVAVLAAGPSLAADRWAETISRGLPVLGIETEMGALRVTCDPERVFGPSPNGSVVVALPGDPDPDLIAFLAETGEQARLPVQSGVARQVEADPEEWVRMVGILRAGGRFAVVSSRSSVIFETEVRSDFDCG